MKDPSAQNRDTEEAKTSPRKASAKELNEKQTTTNVLYVPAKDAKTLKTNLEEEGYLDKRYRMTKAERGPSLENAAGVIAVPVTEECVAILEERGVDAEWVALIVARGQQQVPFSTALLGQQK